LGIFLRRVIACIGLVVFLRGDIDWAFLSSCQGTYSNSTPAVGFTFFETVRDSEDTRVRNHVSACSAHYVLFCSAQMDVY
jgi:hypothetical protein